VNDATSRHTKHWWQTNTANTSLTSYFNSVTTAHLYRTNTEGDSEKLKISMIYPDF